MADGDVNGVVYDLPTLLSSNDRDFLVRNNGDQVKISSLKGKIVGLYFTGFWGPCPRLSPKLVEVYKEVAPKGDFEVVFVSSDKDDESFQSNFSEMPWLSIPFSDYDTRYFLEVFFKVRGLLSLVFVDWNGKVSAENGTTIVIKYGVDGYPFTRERIDFLNEQEEEDKRNLSLSSILVSSSRNYLTSNDGKQVPFSELEGKIVGLYFSVPCVDFTTKLIEVYNKLKEKGEEFEIVLISWDSEDEKVEQGFETMPWLTLPFKVKSIEKLARLFEISIIPTLVIMGPDGKTLNPNVTELIVDDGIDAYPFTPEKISELDEIKKAKQEAETLESLLVYEDKDFVIGKNGSKVLVSELVGKNILLYVSAHWFQYFTSDLIRIYHEMKAKYDAFEVVYISRDSDESSFDEYFSTMPWLALPYGDSRNQLLYRKFKGEAIPMVIAIGPSGRILTKQALVLLSVHGSSFYPFTEELLNHLEEEQKKLLELLGEQHKHLLT